MLKNQQFNFSIQNLKLLRLYLYSNLNVINEWLISRKKHTRKKLAHAEQIETSSSIQVSIFP